jgi:hypothetical protein
MNDDESGNHWGLNYCSEHLELGEIHSWPRPKRLENGTFSAFTKYLVLFSRIYRIPVSPSFSIILPSAFIEIDEGLREQIILRTVSFFEIPVLGFSNPFLFSIGNSRYTRDLLQTSTRLWTTCCAGCHSITGRSVDSTAGVSFHPRHWHPAGNHVFRQHDRSAAPFIFALYAMSATYLRILKTPNHQRFVAQS